jgi:hypothetical protein
MEIYHWKKLQCILDLLWNRYVNWKRNYSQYNKTNESIIQKLKKENETIMIELADMHARLKVLEQQLAELKA